MIMENNQDEAYVTLVSSDLYVVGAMVLGHSIRESGSTRRMICMVTTISKDGAPSIAADSIAALRELWEVRLIEPLDSGDESRLRLLGRLELGPTFAKIRLWSFTDLSKAVFLDADMLVIRNIDDLFDREEFSACADVGWPDCFNSGLFVCRPSLATYHAILQLSETEGSFDGNNP